MFTVPLSLFDFRPPVNAETLAEGAALSHRIVLGKTALHARLIGFLVWPHHG
jgi:hypothetical protein